MESRKVGGGEAFLFVARSQPFVYLGVSSAHTILDFNYDIKLGAFRSSMLIREPLIRRGISNGTLGDRIPGLTRKIT